MNTSESKPISVSDLNKQIKNILENNISRFWVSGEISNFIHHTSGHMYFTLKDQQSEIRCVMFKGPNQFLQFKPENGMPALAGSVLIVSHRVTSMEQADLILVLDEGKIVDKGSHTDLIQRPGYYQQMWELQNENIS